MDLEGKNLRVVSQGEAKTKSEGYLIAMTYKALEIQERLIRRLLGLMHGSQKRPNWANLKTYLDRRHPRIYSQFSQIDRRVLQTADVIGVTTTGLARRISVLRRVRCKVIICEEAGEAMEPHMISALLLSVEHFIQIGHHQQLRSPFPIPRP